MRAVKDCKYFYTVVGDSVPDSIITNEEFANLIDVTFRNLRPSRGLAGKPRKRVKIRPRTFRAAMAIVDEGIQ